MRPAGELAAAAGGTQPLAAFVDATFTSGGALARTVPGYEEREGQQRMAAAVAAAIDEGGTLLAEAGTGTGKTLAYLIPGILSRQRVLVSTGTKNLQEQIFFKDLPSLRESLGVPFTATLMKGRGNYLCLHRWESYKDGVEGNTSAHGRLIESGDRLLVPIISAWVKTTQTGDRAELSDLPEDLPLWKELAAEADTCLGTECPRHGECFVTLMRQRAAESDVVIVNHHLLCADAAVRQGEYGEVIPSCPTLVVDEAHQLEDVATQYFGLSFSSFRVDELARDVERLLGAAIAPGRHASAVVEAVMSVRDAARAFFAGLAMDRSLAESRSDTRVRYTSDAMTGHWTAGSDLVSALRSLEGTLALAGGADASSGTEMERTGAHGGETVDVPATESVSINAVERRSEQLADDLRSLLRADDSAMVYFVEVRGRGIFLRAAPIDVSRVVRDAVLQRFRTVVLTSATLAVDSSFEYIRTRLGLQKAAELRVTSEFDYASQALLYLPRRMPLPKAPGFSEAVAREAIQILQRSQGRAFVLFTSYAVLRTVQAFVEMALPYPVLVQGTAPRSLLLDQFRRTPNAILLATSSFWQGVDVVGDALSCVIIDKLPFASPADPITAARIDAIRADGGDAFADYQVPLAILTLLQGLGRLIRHRRDRGVLAVLDPRLRSMGYGRRFLASLPPAPVTHDLDDVASFFK
jgi:ATP-dependent DNA helicase DinG